MAMRFVPSPFLPDLVIPGVNQLPHRVPPPGTWLFLTHISDEVVEFVWFGPGEYGQRMWHQFCVHLLVVGEDEDARARPTMAP